MHTHTHTQRKRKAAATPAISGLDLAEDSQDTITSTRQLRRSLLCKPHTRLCACDATTSALLAAATNDIGQLGRTGPCCLSRVKSCVVGIPAGRIYNCMPTRRQRRLCTAQSSSIRSTNSSAARGLPTALQRGHATARLLTAVLTAVLFIVLWYLLR